MGLREQMLKGGVDDFLGTGVTVKDSSVTVKRMSVTLPQEVSVKRGRGGSKPKGDVAMTNAERARKYRAAKKGQTNE